MHLINKITIRYFRSLHAIDLKKCTDLNVITGRNDVGKSNVLKALNLFFNEQTDWESRYDFYDNFSKKRLEEVRKVSVKGKQFISIKLEFDRPDNYKGSLPKVFTVERRWNRDSKTYEQTDNLTSLAKAGRLPSTLTTAQRNLVKFLNRTHFEYVPAIKDRQYVNELLARLQRSLLDLTIEKDENLLDTANNLAAYIEGQIVDLKEDFEKATAIDTSIKPPSNISSLFQSFLVSTETDDGDVPLIFRGDGLQARYVASVLHYIALNSRDFYVWGYEEPEIALEYLHASRLAKDFQSMYSKSVQIFATSHSPAFIALGDDVACYRATQEDSATLIANVGLNADLKNKEKIKEELGILEIQKEIHELYYGKLEQLSLVNKRVVELQDEVNNLHKPLLVTEGKTDRKILNVALEKLNEVPDILVRECDNSGGLGGSGGAGSLRKLIESIHPDDDRVVISLFDNDEAGQNEFNKLSRNFSKTEDDPEIKYHKNGYAWAMLLPEPDFRAGFVAAKNLTIEYLFKDEVLEQPFDDGSVLELKDPAAQFVFGGQRVQEFPAEILEFMDAQAGRYKKIGEGKDQFSEEIIPNLDIEDFKAFEDLFEVVKWILEE